MPVDYVLNGQGHGPVAETLSGNNFDTGMNQPYIDSRGNRCVDLLTGRVVPAKQNGKVVINSKTNQPIMVQERKKHLIGDLVSNGIMSPVFNATSLRKEQWIYLQQQVHLAARYRLRAWSELAAASSYGGFNGFNKMVLEHETMSDPGEAMVDMDALSEGRTDSPLFQLQGTPLPITHADFWMSKRKLEISQQSPASPLNTRMAEAATRRVAEMVEKTLIGIKTGITYGSPGSFSTYGRTPSVYGYTNFPARLTKTNLTAPTANGWTPSKTIDEVLAMIDLLTANKFYGPFMVYHTNDWDRYMNNDYILTGGNVATQTLRQRLKAIDGINDVRRLDMWFGSQPSSSTGPGTDVDVTLKPFSLLVVQMTSEVAQAINGMDITTVQWESQGGFRLNFKVMCIMVPQLYADYYGNCGIVHGTTS